MQVLVIFCPKRLCNNQKEEIEMKNINPVESIYFSLPFDSVRVNPVEEGRGQTNDRTRR